MRSSIRMITAVSIFAICISVAALTCNSVLASPNPKVFLELVCDGGIDPSMVFDWKGSAAPFAGEAGSYERTAAPGLRHVSHPSRPAVDAFFDQWGAKVAILNGVGFVPNSALHASKAILSMDTLSRTSNGADSLRRHWLASYAFDTGKGRPIPILAFPGINLSGSIEDETLIGRVPGRLLSLAPSSSILPAPVTDRIFRNMRKDFATLGAAFKPGGMDHADSRVMDRQFRFQQVMLANVPAAWAEAFSPGDPEFVNQARTALRMFASGKSLGAIVRVGGRFGFNARTSHFASQSTRLQALFDGLSRIAGDAYTLGIQNDLVVIVHGTSGRSPWLNSAGGKDPWPYGSMLFFGDGIKMGRIGAFDDRGRGVKIDPRFGTTSGQVVQITPQNAWSTMLMLGKVNYKRWTLVAPISGIIEGQ
jgi:hypothetical protein